MSGAIARAKAYLPVLQNKQTRRIIRALIDEAEASHERCNEMGTTIANLRDEVDRLAAPLADEQFAEIELRHKTHYCVGLESAHIDRGQLLAEVKRLRSELKESSGTASLLGAMVFDRTSPIVEILRRLIDDGFSIENRHGLCRLINPLDGCDASGETFEQLCVKILMAEIDIASPSDSG